MVVLSELEKGRTGRITEVSHPDIKSGFQLGALGFEEGELVRMMIPAPFGDPLQVRVGGTLVAIHIADARYVHVDVDEVSTDHE